jgi:hypothetical protein
MGTRVADATCSGLRSLATGDVGIVHKNLAEIPGEARQNRPSPPPKIFGEAGRVPARGRPRAGAAFAADVEDKSRGVQCLVCVPFDNLRPLLRRQCHFDRPGGPVECHVLRV